MKRKTLGVLMILALLVMAGCGSLGIKDWGDMSVKERGAWMLGLYNAQYDDYLATAGKPTLTESEKDVLRAKKAVLTEVYPKIQLYLQYVDTGKVPMVELEAQIISLLNRLIMAVL